MKAALAAAARSPVFANLLMVFLIVAGVAATLSMRRELFPEFSFDTVVTRVVYPGATPEEIEESITVKIEEAVRSIEGVRKVESVSSEGLATVTIEVDAELIDPRQALVDVRNEVDRITTFPDDAEEPVVELNLNRRNVMTAALAGRVDEASLTQLAYDIESELLLLDGVTEVILSGVRPYEISIAVRENDLQRYGLSFDSVAAAVTSSSLDLPLGRLRTSSEEQLLRVQSRRATGREFAEIPVLLREDGTRVVLRDVATVTDGFDEDRLSVRLEETPAVVFQIRRAASDDVIRVADVVKAYLRERAEELPPGISLIEWRDESQNVRDRLSLLAVNGSQGLLLVFAILLFFLGMRLSFWVALGLPVAFMAAMVFLLAFGGSLNMISSFALIMILGILVDDSIVVGENIARHMREDGYTVESAVRGLHEVTWPVIASVTTTAIAFLPLLHISGVMGKFIEIMPVAVIACLIASLVECLLILPAHLAHAHPPRQRGRPGRVKRFRMRIDAWVDRFIDRRYGPSVDWALANRYIVLAITVCFIIIVAGLAASGRPRFVFFPRLDSEYLESSVTMPEGTSFESTLEAALEVERAAQELRAEIGVDRLGEPTVKRILTKVGTGGVNKASVQLELSRSGDRDVQSVRILQRWREIAGALPLASSVNFAGTSHRPGGSPIELRVLAQDRDTAEAVAHELIAELREFPGVFSIDDNLEPGKRELRFQLTPAARALGVDPAAMARQLYAGFSGREVDELQRGREEVEVRVRYGAGERRRRDQLAQLRLRGGSDDVLLPLEWAADIQTGRGYSRIERRDGRRVVTITADVDDAVTNANLVADSLQTEVLPELLARYPGADCDFGGQQEEQRETMTSLLSGLLLAMFGIYAILCLLFSSYTQPILVMVAIPVGLVGAVLGHYVLGRDMAILSVFGMIGLTGIVVNDALVLIDFINRKRRAGQTALAAAQTSGRVRFRPVFLTTITTVAGLLPLLLETSLQAQFIIPMAVSIASGVTVATFLTLYVVPCAYLILEDFHGLFRAPAG